VVRHQASNQADKKLGTEQAKRKLRTRLRLVGQGQGLSLHTTEWIDLQTALQIRSSLQVVLVVVFALPTAFARTLALPILSS
jgi:hypothetical protein